VLIALAHDLLITAGVYALFDREVTTATVAALLTIMGYSLYDTVIVFDRIRENVPRMPRATFSQIANRSMSEVFTRSLATSFVVLMPVGSLLLFGGETLKDFAFALLVGVASGAYSSIFIATPVLVEWKEREQTYMRRRRLILREHGGSVPAFATGALGEPEPATAGAVAATAAPAEQPPASRRERARRRAAQAGARRGQGATPPPPPPPPSKAATPPEDGAAAAPPEPTAQEPAAPEPSAPKPTAPEPAPAPPAPRSGSKPAKPATTDGDDGAPAAGRAQSRVTSTSGPGKSKRRSRPRKKHGRR
jgi:SecD/SecF fusion protein